MGRPYGITVSVRYPTAILLSLHLILSFFMLVDPQPDASNTVVTISITTHGDNSAGDIYTLKCSATEAADQPTITWLKDGILFSDNNAIKTETVNSNDGSYSCNLTFNPLVASHEGMFTCKAVVGGVVRTMSINVTVEGECTK